MPCRVDLGSTITRQSTMMITFQEVLESFCSLGYGSCYVTISLHRHKSPLYPTLYCKRLKNQHYRLKSVVLRHIPVHSKPKVRPLSRKTSHPKLRAQFNINTKAICNNWDDRRNLSHGILRYGRTYMKHVSKKNHLTRNQVSFGLATARIVMKS